jgi:hypothetical protein
MKNSPGLEVMFLNRQGGDNLCWRDESHRYSKKGQEAPLRHSNDLLTLNLVYPFTYNFA